MRIVFLGPPASGKGTQAKKIAHKFQIPHISTGDILREEVNKKSNVGMKIKQIIEEGKLVDDDTITQTLHNRIQQDDCKKGFVLDGFPRTIKQAETLQNILDDDQKNIDAVINICVGTNELINRMNNRVNLEENKRKDDNQNVLEKRISIYQKQIQKIILFYQNKNILHEIDGMKNIDNVEQQIKKCLQT